MPRANFDNMGGGTQGSAAARGQEIANGRIVRPAARVLPPTPTPKPAPKTGVSKFLEDRRLQKIEAKRPKILPPSSAPSPARKSAISRYLEERRLKSAEAKRPKILPPSSENKR
jgi:hypothetical protein